MLPALALAVFAQLLPIVQEGAIIFPQKGAAIAAQSAKSQAEPDIDDEISQLLDTLLDAGDEQMQAGEFAAAADTFQQARSLITARSLTASEYFAETLLGLGSAYVGLTEYSQALPVLEDALSLYEDRSAARDPSFNPAAPLTSDDARALVYLYGTLGVVHEKLSNFVTALTYYRRAAVEDAERFIPPDNKIQQLHNIAGIETLFGQYAEATATFQQAVELSRQISDPGLQGSLVFGLARVKELQQDYALAVDSYQASIDLLRQSDEPSREMRALNNLGIVYLKMDNLAAAKGAFDRGLALLQAQDDPAERALLVDSLGAFFQASGEVEKAWTQYLQAVQLNRENSYKTAQIESLLNLGRLMEQQQQPDLAIFFYKQAIAQIETIRQDLVALSEDVQRRYILTIEDYYRKTADLLLQQNREAEALQVLELLKRQEVSTYLHSDSLNESQLNESQSEDLNNGLEASAKTLNTLAEDALLELFNALPVETALADFLASAKDILRRDASETTDNDLFNLQAVELLKQIVPAQQAKTAVLYPLILEDRLEILLLTPAGTVERFTTEVSQADLSKTVEDLQRSLKNKALDAKPSAQQLYRWLIGPLSAELADDEVENIIYLPDGALRYVPLAALHDGKAWLVEKYQSHNITAATVGNLVQPRAADLSVMAGAFTDSSLTHQVQVGANTFNYSGLSAATQEINNLVKAVPNTLSLLNNNFTAAQTIGSVGDHRIVHLATHAQFVPGEPEESFILFGDGGTVNMREIQAWALPNVDLVVLSACETASSTQGDGKEILGLGFQIQKTGARAAVASLWAVDDIATAALMSQFYQALSDGQTKAQALKTAQVALIESSLLNDPYDWAAFILIGNGL